jgi:phosphate-selective porin OprO/OprP
VAASPADDDHRIVDTGTLVDVDGYNTLVLESVYVNGRFSAQAEYMRQDLDRGSLQDLTFDGYYAYVSYFLTDDSRPYSNSLAAFGTLTPSSSAGAWELGARFSTLDLTDGGISGGEVDSLTFAVNYYMTRDLRFQLNYIMTDSDDVAGDDNPNALQLRLRFTF